MPSHNNSTVRIADGSLSRVARTGLVQLTKDLTFSSILYVLNLIAIYSPLVNSLMVSIVSLIFFPNLCEFQALDLGRKIGGAEM